MIGDGVRNISRNAVNIGRGRQVFIGDQIEEFSDLKGVSFEVKRREILGISERNEAGKTRFSNFEPLTEPTRDR